MVSESAEVQKNTSELWENAENTFRYRRSKAADRIYPLI